LLKEFVDRQMKRLLVVEDDENQRNAIVELIGDGDIETTAVSTGDEALQALRATHFDCMVIDLGLPDMSGFDVLEKLKKEFGLHDLPVIVYTAKELSGKEETRLRKLAESIVIKDARSPERLLAETSLFLHRVSAKLSPSKRRILEEESNADPVLAGKKVLIIDDDVRNIFSLTSLLERHHMEVAFAENGRDGIELLKASQDVDVILVDIMMPEMDGYETMREIRKMRRFKDTPMIALTAKAMRGDLEKCVEAGASDYISKPADVDRLLSLLRMYLAA
jgi:CheY-like chemotaxis protein